MKKNVKDKWLKALRSGEYRQHKGSLRSSGRTAAPRHCCLGVLCDLASKAGVGKWNIRDLGFVTDTDYEESVLPEAVMQWAGISSPSGMLGSSGVELSALNDGLRVDAHDFNQIADIIEKNWRKI